MWAEMVPVSGISIVFIGFLTLSWLQTRVQGIASMPLSLGQEQVNSFLGGAGAFDVVHPVDLNAFLYNR